MKFPFIVEKNIGKRNCEKWQKFYNKNIGGRDCFKEEGLWRRSQEEVNKEHSGWGAFCDKRRRIVHYEHEFFVKRRNNKCSFLLKKTYLWISLSLPNREIDDYLKKIEKDLKNSFWWKKEKRGGVYRCGELFFRIERKECHEEDIKAGRSFPDNYGFFDINLYSKDNEKNKSFVMKPWLVLKHGIREMDVRGNPVITRDPSIILKHLPAQVELGGGASTEIGIFPLNFLHKVYSIYDKNRKFVFDYENDFIVQEIARNPASALNNFSAMHRSIIKAEPNDFYKVLKKMHEKKFIVGPIITNNFDGLIRQVGLEENYIRKYSDNAFPDIEFHKDAKSLIVVGVHADRRHVQRSARKRGLKVIYIDPEKYVDIDGEPVDYFLESPQDGDILIKNKAGVVFKFLKEKLFV